MVRIRSSLNKNIDDVIMTFTNCIEKWQLLQSVLYGWTYALVKEKSHESSRLHLVFKCAWVKQDSLLVVSFVVS